MEKLDVGLETFYIVNRVILNGHNTSVVDDFVMKDAFHHAFFMRQIIEEGLHEFHLTIVSGCTDDEKREILNDTIERWGIKGEKITNL